MHWSIGEWALVAWTSILAGAVISAEVATALWWSGESFLPGKQALAIGVPFAAAMLWTVGILVFLILVLLGAWLVETATRFTHWMRASRAP
jgi:nucleoside recognition membrane protein YjiH